MALIKLIVFDMLLVKNTIKLGMKSNFKMQLIPLSFNVYSASNIENY